MDEDADHERLTLARSGGSERRGSPGVHRRALCLAFVLACALGPAPIALRPLQAQTDGADPLESSRSEVVISQTLSRSRVEVREAVEKGLRFLGDQQFTAIGKKYEVAVTSLAGLAVLGAGYQPRGGKYSGLLAQCVTYLVGIERNGYMTEQDEGSRMHGHCYAVLFLTQILGSLSPEEERTVFGVVQRGVRVIERAQSSLGGWYYEPNNRDNKDEASVTVCALQALRAARNVGVSVDSFRVKQALRYVRDCQAQDGSFAYSLAHHDRGRRTYALTVAALSTLNAAGVYDSPELTRGFNYVRRRLAAFPRSPWRAAEEEYPYYANLYAAQTLYQDGGDLWASWYPAVSEYLRSKQNEGGFWESTNYGPEYATACAILILEVPLGYLPIFQR